MPGRRQSAADLPRAPLELAHPLAIQGGGVPGAEILSDGLGPTAVLLFRLHRALLAWTADPAEPPAADRAALRRIEDSLLSRLDEDEVAAPLAVLTAALLDPEAADPKRFSWACLCVSDWALERGAKATAVAYAQLAALSWPRHARYAWVVGRMMCAFGRAREAEPWFRRAHRVAVWTDDWEAQARSINSLGLVCFERGTLQASKHLHLRAIKIARRHSLRELEGTAAHNLFAVHHACKEFDEAEHYAARAFELYGPSHPRLTEFVADVAIFWNEQGYYWRTLPILRTLRGRFQEPEARIRISAALARAAGGAGDLQAFCEAWGEVDRLAGAVPDSLVAAAFYEAGLGAASLSDGSLACGILSRALECASASGAAEIEAKAELALEKLKRDEDHDPAIKRRPEPGPRQAADLMAEEFVASLNPKLIRAE